MNNNTASILTAARAVAIASPCLLHQETTRPRFAWRPWSGWTLVLSVNSGYE